MIIGSVHHRPHAAAPAPDSRSRAARRPDLDVAVLRDTGHPDAAAELGAVLALAEHR
jgi:hypothetical protein